MFSRRAFAGMIAAGLTEAAFAQRAKLSGVAPADTVWINGNEFPEGPPQASIDAMAQIIGTSNRYHYQEFPAFYAKLAANEGLNADQILVGAGSSEPLHAAVEAFTSPTVPLIIPMPTYEAAPELTRYKGNPVIETPLNANMAPDVHRLAAEAEKAGFHVSRIGKGTGTDLIAELAPEMHKKHVFLPRSDRAGAAHFAQLHQAGAYVREFVAYRTVPCGAFDPAVMDAEAHADAILFFSPSAVHAFNELVHSEVLPPVPDSTGIGAIGPVTRENLIKEARMRCDFQAHEPAIDQVIAALEDFFEKRKAPSAGAPVR